MSPETRALIEKQRAEYRWIKKQQRLKAETEKVQRRMTKAPETQQNIDAEDLAELIRNYAPLCEGETELEALRVLARGYLSNDAGAVRAFRRFVMELRKRR